MPELHVDVDAIGRNTEVVASLLRGHGLDLVGVTKGCLGEPRVAAAMLAGGAVALADTRDHNLRRLRDALPRAELHRIHLPLARVEPFEPGDVTYVTSAAGAAAVAAAPRPVRLAGSRPRRVMLPVESGDEREGVPFDGLLALAEAVSRGPSPRTRGRRDQLRLLPGRPRGYPEVAGDRRSGRPRAARPPDARSDGCRVAIPACSRSCARGSDMPGGGDRIALRRGPAAGAGRPRSTGPCRAVPAPCLLLGPKCSRSILSCLQRRAAPGSSWALVGRI